MFVILGNSGSGKTTLALRLGQALGLTPLDLDTVYWEPDQPGVARPKAEAVRELQAQLGDQSRWIVEGCYETLAASLLPLHPQLIWLDPGQAACQAHCRARPWEPHKYPNKEAQDANLAMLLKWVEDHYRLTGAMSHAAHKALFENYAGPKHHVRSTDIPLDEWL